MSDDKRREKADPTVKSDPNPWGSYAEDRGNHAPRPLTEVTHSATNVEYADPPHKPDPTTVAQVEVGPDKP